MPVEITLEGPRCAGCGEELTPRSMVYEYHIMSTKCFTHANAQCWLQRVCQRPLNWYKKAKDGTEVGVVHDFQWYTLTKTNGLWINTEDKLEYTDEQIQPMFNRVYKEVE